MTENNYFGNNVRILCTVYSISRAKIAERIGKTPETMSRMINHPGYKFSIEEIISIANVFETDLETLIKTDLSGEIKKIIERKRSKDYD